MCCRLLWPGCSVPSAQLTWSQPAPRCKTETLSSQWFIIPFLLGQAAASYGTTPSLEQGEFPSSVSHLCPPLTDDKVAEPWAHHGGGSDCPLLNICVVCGFLATCLNTQIPSRMGDGQQVQSFSASCLSCQLNDIRCLLQTDCPASLGAAVLFQVLWYSCTGSGVHIFELRAAQFNFKPIIRPVNLASVGRNPPHFWVSDTGLLGKGCCIHTDHLNRGRVWVWLDPPWMCCLWILNLLLVGCLGLWLYCTEDKEHSSSFLNPWQCDGAHLK